ncbi:MAG: adenylate/guanylate cyclase domain-containing protein, partial [Desulfuromonadales bacterium]
DLLATFGSAFLHGLIYFAIGVVVFILKPDSTVSLLFFVASFFQGASALVDFDVASSASPFSYLMIACDTLIPALMLHFAAIFPIRHAFVDRRPRLFFVPYVFWGLCVVPLLLIYPGPLFYQVYFAVVYSSLYLAIFCFLGAILYAYFRSISSLARQRARVIFWGAAFAFPLPLLAAVLSNTGAAGADISVFTNLTALPVIIFPIAIAYSITRHNLFDVDVYIKRAVGYAIMTAIVGATYLSLQITLKSVIFASLRGKSAEYVYPVIFALLVVFLFNPINRRVQDFVDRLFFRRKFDYKEAVISISNALSSVLNREETIDRIVGAIRKEMFIDNAGVVVLDRQSGVHRGYFVADEDGGVVRERDIDSAAGQGIIGLLAERRQLITSYDIAENPLYAEHREEYLERFTRLGLTMAIPMVYHDHVNAIVMVGHKKSGQFFGKEDVELLTTLASQGAVALENARLAEQMKREAAVRTSLSRYLSPQVVEGIVKSDLQVNLGGARKVVTVLFSDIRDFTTITEHQPPDQLVRILNEYFTGMADVIFAHQGSLDKYIGDAIVAVFGSLIPLENPETHAAQAAIAMMHRLEELNRRWEERGDFPMHMGIGICTGEVFLGNIGSIERMEFTVIGDTVNMASRLSGVAKGGQIVVTESVQTHLGSALRVEELPPVQVKGKERLHQVYEVIVPALPVTHQAQEAPPGSCPP